MKSITAAALGLPVLVMSFMILAPMAHALDGEYVATEVVTSYVSGNSPTMILAFDNNLEICLELRQPGSMDDLLERDIAVTRSQLLVLRLWGLIASDENDRMYFTLPVIDASHSLELTELARGVAEEVLAASRDDVEAFMSVVHAEGWTANGYALLGSFVLDGLLWPALERQGVLEQSDPTEFESGSEYWSGLSWVNLSPVSKTLGTNSIATSSGTMHAAWTPASLEVQGPLWRKGMAESVTGLATGLIEHESAESQELVELGLFGADRSPNFPVIDVQSPLCKQGEILALRVAQAMAETSELKDMLELVGAPNPSAAMIMAHHWVYPEILGILEAEGISPPPVLEEGSTHPVAATIFVTGPDADCVDTVD
jgi:hypothetical protein